MKISPPALIVIVGTLVIVGAFIVFGKAQTSGDTVPVPIIVNGATSGTIGYSYRGLFIGVVPAGSVPIIGFASAHQWNVYTTDDFNVSPLATGEADTAPASLGAAMGWVDKFRSTPLMP